MPIRFVASYATDLWAEVQLLNSFDRNEKYVEKKLLNTSEKLENSLRIKNKSKIRNNSGMREYIEN